MPPRSKPGDPYPAAPLAVADAGVVEAGPVSASFWDLRLYIAGQTPRSVAALANLRRICDEHFPGKHRIEIIDLVAHPELARQDQILAIPTLVRNLPAPARKIIGDLSQTERVLVGLDVRTRPAGV